MPATQLPKDEAKVLPLDVALKVLDIADANDWYYAPVGDGCHSRRDLEKILRSTPNAPFSLVINYVEDYADTVSVSFYDGKVVLEIEDHFYFDDKSIDSLDELKETVWSMLKKLNSQP